MGARWILWQILAALAQSEEAAAKAGDLRRQAQEIVEYIAENVGEAELKSLFLNLPAVREINR